MAEEEGKGRLGHGSKRGRREEAAIAALLHEPTLAHAAAKAGISPRTLKRWLTDLDFQAAYRAARRQIVDTAAGRLQEATAEATEALRALLNSENDTAKLGAAKAIWDLASKTQELTDFAERLERLELRLREREEAHRDDAGSLNQAADPAGDGAAAEPAADDAGGAGTPERSA
jgi:hypothetical protein